MNGTYIDAVRLLPFVLAMDSTLFFLLPLAEILAYPIYAALKGRSVARAAFGSLVRGGLPPPVISCVTKHRESTKAQTSTPSMVSTIVCGVWPAVLSPHCSL